MIEIWGHRGAYDFAPENTLASFQKAIEMGAHGIEFDIQLTRDGEIVVIHDETIDRVSNGSGYVKDYTLSELKKFNFNKRGLTEPLFMEIPTLAETLELLKPTGLDINIELKTGIIYYEDIEAKALQMVKDYNMMDRIIWSSFNHYSVQTVKLFYQQARIALLCGGGILTTGEECEKTGAEALHPGIHQLNCPALILDCRWRGIKVRPYTVNSPEDFQLAAKCRVDGIFTNNIEFARAELTK